MPLGKASELHFLKPFFFFFGPEATASTFSELG